MDTSSDRKKKLTTLSLPMATSDDLFSSTHPLTIAVAFTFFWLLGLLLVFGSLLWASARWLLILTALILTSPCLIVRDVLFVLGPTSLTKRTWDLKSCTSATLTTSLWTLLLLKQLQSPCPPPPSAEAESPSVHPLSGTHVT